MGALEFKPALGPGGGKSVPIEVAELTQLAADILGHQESWAVKFKGARADALNAIIRVARPPAATGQGGDRVESADAGVRLGAGGGAGGIRAVDLKFDGVNDVALGDPNKVYIGRIEYACHKIGRGGGNRNARFGRCWKIGARAFHDPALGSGTSAAENHMQSLCAMGHYDFNAAGEHGYEQAFSRFND